jgi:hypothetical protein
MRSGRSQQEEQEQQEEHVQAMLYTTMQQR